jgi:hypothetical protein
MGIVFLLLLGVLRALGANLRAGYESEDPGRHPCCKYGR